MASSFVGRTSSCGATVIGRAVLGIASEVTLTIDASTSLAVDELAELVVAEGVTWIGATAARSISYGGGGAIALPETKS
jgi:hypothetical protein